MGSLTLEWLHESYVDVKMSARTGVISGPFDIFDDYWPGVGVSDSKLPRLN